MREGLIVNGALANARASDTPPNVKKKNVKRQMEMIGLWPSVCCQLVNCH